MTDEIAVSAALYNYTDGILAGLGFTPDLVDWGLPFSAPAKLGDPNDDPENVPRTIEVRHFRNAPIAPNWDNSGTVFQGIWQISVIDYTQKGEFPPLAAARDIAAAFAKDTEFWHGSTAVKISGAPSILTVIEDGHKAIYPVSVPYRCFA